MDNIDWPMFPSFLSLRKGCSEEDANYNLVGIYYPDYLRGFLADLSHDKNIQNALSIFQFVPNNFHPLDSNADDENTPIVSETTGATILFNQYVNEKMQSFLGERKIIRIDSGTFINNGKLCDLFRQCGHKRCCFEQDSLVAIYAKDELNDFNPESLEYNNCLNNIVKDINKGKDETFLINLETHTTKKRNRSYIHYTCPYSLYEEHIFPIYTQGRIIACLMFGQMARDAFDDKKAFENYKEEMEKKTISPNSLEKSLSQVKKINEYDWKIKLETIIERIETFEDRLNDRIIHKNTTYINEKFKEIEDKFRDDVRNINTKSPNISDKFSTALNEAFNRIRETFDSENEGFLRMFALPFDAEHNELSLIGWSGNNFNKQNKNKYTISLKQLKKLKHYSLQNKEYNTQVILESASLPIRNEHDDRDLFYFEKQANNEVAYVVWKRHSNKTAKNEQSKIIQAYKEALKKFYSIVLECSSYIHGTRMRLLLEASIRESAHESANFILPAINVVKNQLKMVPDYFIYPKYSELFNKSILDPFNKQKEEVLESFLQLHAINTGPSLIFSSDEEIKKAISKKSVQVFPILYKLKKMHDKRASDSYKIIRYNQKESYVEANIDVAYLNHALLNLLDNAIKYGFDGTTIHINTTVNRKEGLLEIQFISYGIQINNDTDIYALWERSEEATRMSKGTGLGMYIVKKVCNVHGGEITHRSEPLSLFNIPVLYNYKYKNSLARGFSDAEIKQFNDELNRLSDNIEKDVVNNPIFVKYAYVFKSRINTPTFKNTFYITIPLK